jgi:uncharacterized membrane protein YagU involved in acid resistance
MNARLLSGAAAGIAGGVIFGVMMQMMNAPTPDGGSTPMMQMVAMVVGSTSLAVGWLYHLFNSAVIGALFAWLFGNRTHDYIGGFSYGALWGVVWWILGGLILMPLLLDMPVFAPLQMPPMRMVAIGSLIGHLIYGLTLGGVYVRLTHSGAVEQLRPLER